MLGYTLHAAGQRQFACAKGVTGTSTSVGPTSVPSVTSTFIVQNVPSPRRRPLLGSKRWRFVAPADALPRASADWVAWSRATEEVSNPVFLPKDTSAFRVVGW